MGVKQVVLFMEMAMEDAKYHTSNLNNRYSKHNHDECKTNKKVEDNGSAYKINQEQH